jgi:hypothetical protein
MGLPKNDRAAAICAGRAVGRNDIGKGLVGVNRAAAAPPDAWSARIGALNKRIALMIGNGTYQNTAVQRIAAAESTNKPGLRTSKRVGEQKRRTPKTGTTECVD